MDLDALVRGMAVGVLVAAPVGPIGVLCIQRTLLRGRLAGVVSGLGAATADAFYAAIAAFGLISLHTVDWLREQWWLRILGAVVLGLIGLLVFFSRPPEGPRCRELAGLVGVYASTLGLTLTNPLTILSFTAVFAVVGIKEGVVSYLSGSILVLGVFAGSALWFAALSGGVNLFRARMSPIVVRAFNRICGLVIAGLGILGLFGSGHQTPPPADVTVQSSPFETSGVADHSTR